VLLVPTMPAGDPRITGVRALPLLGSTPDGGWGGEDDAGFAEEEVLHTLIEITTDVGIGGLGSVFTSLTLVEGAIELLSKHLIGESAQEPQRVTENLHQQTFWQGRGGSVTHAISGIDIALWDIFGKLCGQPVSRLLGGRYREEIRPYGSLLMAEPEEMKRRVLDAMRRGFRSFKIGWGPFGRVDAAMDEAIVSAAREVAGPDCEIMVDAGGSDAFWPHGYKWAINTARMLQKYDVAWFEEALRPDDLEGFVKLTEHSPVPISSCEVFTRRQQFDEWIERRAVDYIQPDVTKCGGLTEEYRIAMHAYERSVLFIPHGWNTAVGLAADLQLVAAVPVARWVEYITPAPYIEDLVEGNPFALSADGMLCIPSGPGLGVVWSDAGIEKHSGGMRISDQVLGVVTPPPTPTVRRGGGGAGGARL
jgi:L-alanine-DL-glutamate epimerase-like enolase superfamily enzyme